MRLECTQSGLPVFRCTSPVSRGTLKSIGGGKSSFQYNAEPQTAELLLGAIIAVNIFLQNLYHVSQSTKLWTPKHGETWRRNVMNN